MEAQNAPARPSRWPLLAALAYTAFPVYGSLVPLRWAPADPGQAWARFAALLEGPLTVASRPDFAANLLLALPLALLWLAAVASRLRLRSAMAIALTAVVVWAACSALAVSLEFAQTFFAGRQPTLSDIVAQSIGAALGVLAWPLVPRSFWQRSASPDAAWRRAALVYVIGLVVYALLPLDLTVSRSEIVDKWKSGKVQLLPFATWDAQPVAGLVDFALDATIWALAALLIRRAWSIAPGAAGLALVALAALLELAQILVLSRVVDTTDIVAAAAGVAVATAVRWTGKRRASVGDPSIARRIAWVWPLLAALSIIALQTWPFDFASEPQALRERTLMLDMTPFASYATATELYLVTNALRRVAIYGGFALTVAWVLGPWPRSRAGRAAVAAVSAAALATVVEVLQVLLPGRVVDTGDVLIAAAAGLMAVGLWPSSARTRPQRVEGYRIRAVTAAEDRALDDAAGQVAPDPRVYGGPSVPVGSDRAAARVAVLAAFATAVVLASGLALALVPTVPYNLRELLAPDGRPWSALVIPAVALAMFGLPPWIGRAAVPSRGVPVAQVAAALVAGPLALALLLLVAAPLESLHDLVGAPVLDIAPAIELTGRLAVLLAGVVWALALGSALHGALLPPGWRGGSVAHLILHGLWVLPAWHLVVVSWAATDNLTELMAGGGGIRATACVLAYACLVGLTASVLVGAAIAPDRRRIVVGVLWALSSVGLGWLLASAGTQDAIVKYGRMFSALQFLLSASRDTYVSGLALGIRFALAHLAAIGLSMAGMLVAATWFAWRARPSVGRRPAKPAV